MTVWPGPGPRPHQPRVHAPGRKAAGDRLGMDQFLDIGTGIPTEPNLHQVVQSELPHARVVYVDNDPIVLAHARALMGSAPEGRTAYLHASVTGASKPFWAPPSWEGTLDLSRPVARARWRCCTSCPTSRGAYDIVERLVAALPSGSALVLSHGTGDFDPDAMGQVANVYKSSGTGAQARSKAEFARFFDGLELRRRA